MGAVVKWAIPWVIN